MEIFDAKIREVITTQFKISIDQISNILTELCADSSLFDDEMKKDFDDFFQACTNFTQNCFSLIDAQLIYASLNEAKEMVEDINTNEMISPEVVHVMCATVVTLLLVVSKTIASRDMKPC